MTIRKLSKQSLPAVFGVIVAMILISVQLNNAGVGLIMDARATSLVFISQIEAFFPLGRHVQLWIESKSRLSKKILEYELRVRELEATTAKLSQIQKENEDLKESFVGRNRNEWLGASLLKGGGKYLIDVGNTNGVKPLGIVLVRGAFLGVVKDVYQNTSVVNSIFDNEARLAVRVGRGSAVGIMRSKTGTLILTTISRTEGIDAGETVTTLGDENVKQAGLLVGYIEENLTRPADPVSTYKVKPAVTVNEARAVIVSMESR
jgi:cell shape-determining protein MreC